MCGRMTITEPERVVRKFKPDVNKATLDQPRFNIAPSQMVPALIARDGQRVLGDLQWGLVPHWAEDPTVGQRMINARAETVAEKPAFRAAFKKRRCVIACDGFYEWQKSAQGKQPYYVRVDGGAPFGFAGLYEVWKSADDEKLSTCTIITTTPNEIMSPIHHRMPVILNSDDWSSWLDPANDDSASLQKLLRPFNASRMDAYPISTHVNSPAHDDERCVQPVGLK